MAVNFILSLAFFISFTINLIFSFVILYMKPNGKVNRLLFLTGISLCFWSFGFALTNISATVETALFWRKISAIGWTTVHAFLLHTILILVNKEQSLKKIHKFLLYIPALVSLVVFSLYSNVADGQYVLILSRAKTI